MEGAALQLVGQISHFHTAFFILLAHKELSFFRLTILVSGGTQGKKGMSDGCLHEVGRGQMAAVEEE